MYLRYNFVKDIVDTGSITVQYCPSDRMSVDILKKPITREAFEEFRKELSVLDRSDVFLRICHQGGVDKT